MSDVIQLPNAVIPEEPETELLIRVTYKDGDKEDIYCNFFAQQDPDVLILGDGPDVLPHHLIPLYENVKKVETFIVPRREDDDNSESD